MENREITFVHNDDVDEWCGQYCAAMLFPSVSESVIRGIKAGNGISTA
jgi:hypothetical protein